MPPRRAKRKRASSPEKDQATQQPPSSGDKHLDFTKWSKDRGVVINGVKPAQIPGRGLGLTTTKSIREGDRLLFIPEKAMLVPDQLFLEQEGLAEASPQAQLTACALDRFFRPGESEGRGEPAWSIWSATWPTMRDFEDSRPMCWSEHLRDILPEAARQPLSRQLADYAKDWAAVQSFCKTHGFEEKDFKYLWMIVDSRSFHWKPPRAKAGSMAMCPFVDYMNHGPSDSGCLVSQSAKGYQVVANRDYEPNEEVLATYGPHPNTKLLIHYGFTLPHNTPAGHSPDDDIRLDALLLPHLPPSLQSQLQDLGFLGPYSLLPASNELCFKTQVAVRALLLTCNEWEYFASSGEDLSGHREGEVRAFVQGVLRGYRGEAVRMLERAGGVVEEGPRAVLVGWWALIVDAVNAFVAL